MHAVRQLLTRARPSADEVKILHGLARQLKWVATHGVKPEWNADDADGADRDGSDKDR